MFSKDRKENNWKGREEFRRLELFFLYFFERRKFKTGKAEMISFGLIALSFIMKLFYTFHSSIGHIEHIDWAINAVG